ncbi:hypothetical protein GDO78_012984 [Eleutherodactylus coqui]|uniref:Uncharacterized protein n=1 Tax=Eleutherodactylus coqui TaxID=57060 RepID=A0A8J6K311_ELECQ|nr:hypothetical protein GDO78_012984 [Eleutherodactylus coqui]
MIMYLLCSILYCNLGCTVLRIPCSMFRNVYFFVNVFYILFYCFVFGFFLILLGFFSLPSTNSMKVRIFQIPQHVIVGPFYSSCA